MSEEHKIFPGCLIQNRLPFLEASAKISFDILNFKYSDGKFGCCPNPVGLKHTSLKSWAVLAARNITEAEKEEKPIVSLCNGCFQSLYVADFELKHDKVLRNEVNALLSKVNKEYKGTTQIKHFVGVLHDEIGLEEIKKRVVKPLTGLKVACHVGCHYARPSNIISLDDPLHPTYLRELVEALGATPVDYSAEMTCCGNSVRNSNEDLANDFLKQKIDSASDANADCIVVNCPACFQQFDSNQKKLKKFATENQEYKMPVLYITELIALAFGKTSKEIGLNFHQNKVKKILSKLGIE